MLASKVSPCILLASSPEGSAALTKPRAARSSRGSCASGTRSVGGLNGPSDAGGLAGGVEGIMAGGYTLGGTEMADKQVPGLEPALATTADGASGAAACRGAASDVFLRPLGNPPDADNANLGVAGGRGTADGATDCGVAVAVPTNRGPGQLQPSPAPHQPQGADGPAWKDYQTVFTNAKAGMDGVDKARVQQVVWEMSKDSAHFKNEQRKQASVLERIERMKQRSAALTTMEITAAGR